MSTCLKFLTVLCVVAPLTAAAWISVDSPSSATVVDPTLKIVHIRVGQGDATLILGPEQAGGNRNSVLIDAGDIPNGGDRDGGRIVAAVLAKNKVTKVDYFVVTHYDADHIGGAVAGSSGVHGHSFILGWDNAPGNAGDDDNDGTADWLDAGRVRPDPEELGTGDDIRGGTFVDRGDEDASGTQTYQKFRALASTMGARTSLTNQAEVDGLAIDLGGGATMTCLAANGFVRGRSAPVGNVNTENERSLCFLLDYGSFQYFIGGDLVGRSYGSENAKVEAAVGEWITSNNKNVDILHVNHHGGNNCSEASFLAAVAPEVAVISVGNGNSHGHPHADVLQRLVDADVNRIIQTSWGAPADAIPEEVCRRQAICQGDIVIATDGAEFTISTERTFATDG